MILERNLNTIDTVPIDFDATLNVDDTYSIYSTDDNRFT